MTKLPFEAAQPRKFDYFSVFLWPDKVNFNSKSVKKLGIALKHVHIPQQIEYFILKEEQMFELSIIGFKRGFSNNPAKLSFLF